MGAAGGPEPSWGAVHLWVMYRGGLRKGPPGTAESEVVIALGVSQD